MEHQIEIVVVGHHSRIVKAQRLSEILGARLLVDDGDHGANRNHYRALEWAAEQSCRVVVLEDDALPVAGFTEQVSEWLNRFPDSLVSFYLGTGRPPQYQIHIADRLIVSARNQAAYITLPRLILGVLFSEPPQHVECVLSRWVCSQRAAYAVVCALCGSLYYAVRSSIPGSACCSAA